MLYTLAVSIRFISHSGSDDQHINSTGARARVISGRTTYRIEFVCVVCFLTFLNIFFTYTRIFYQAGRPWRSATWVLSLEGEETARRCAVSPLSSPDIEVLARSQE